MNILYSLLISFFVLNSSFSSDFICRENIMDKEEAEFILSFLPPQISSLPRRINAMDVTLRGSCNAAIFLGRPGGGKSDAMEAIAALIDEDWSIHRIEESELHQKPGARGDSTYQFNRLLDAMKQVGGKHFIIMDELNGYLEHFNSEHHDTDSFSRAFWKMLDKHLKKPEYFLIGSVNEFDKVPQQVKDRLHDCIRTIDGFTSPEHFHECLVKIMSTAPRFAIADGNNDYIVQRFTDSGVQTARSTRSLLYSAFEEATSFAEDYNHIPVQREHIDEAIVRRKDIDVKIEYGKKTLSDEERRYQEQKRIQRRQRREDLARLARQRREDIARQERQRREDLERHLQERAADEFRANVNTTASVASATASIAGLGVALHNNPEAVETGLRYVHKGLGVMVQFLEVTSSVQPQEPCSIQ